jgi:hypothetical protein
MVFTKLEPLRNANSAAMNTNPKLTDLELKVLKSAISKIEVQRWRETLMKQVNVLCVRERTEKTVGYYIDFEVPDSLRISDFPTDFNKHPLSIEANHPDGKNGIFFIIYTKDGKLYFMEAASTGDWPLNENQINFCD